MIEKAIRYLIAVIGTTFGFLVYVLFGDLIYDFIKITSIPRNVFEISLAIVLIILFGLIFYIVGPQIIKHGKRIAKLIENQISNVPFPELITSIIGFIVGILIAYLLSELISKILFIGIPLSIMLYIFLGYIGINIGRIKKDEFVKYFTIRRGVSKDKDKNSKKNTGCMPKILDTSVIIDGRIMEIVETGFIEGTIVIPTFVLDELRYIADSSDDLKRTKGRRGLDILNDIQKSSKVTVEINESSIEEANEVDIKLLRLAEKIGGCVITNDYNLNKVAQIQKIKILNINELSNAVKPKLVAGEKLSLQIVKEGKEHSQGVGYLDDGTMIVVENGKKYVGNFVETEVSSILQTPAGRMIFAKIK